MYQWGDNLPDAVLCRLFHDTSTTGHRTLVPSIHRTRTDLPPSLNCLIK